MAFEVPTGAPNREVSREELWVNGMFLPRHKDNPD